MLLNGNIPNAIRRFSESHQHGRPTLKFMWNCEGPLFSQNNTEKEKVEKFVLPCFKTYYKATGIKRILYWHQTRHLDPCNRIEIQK